MPSVFTLEGVQLGCGTCKKVVPPAPVTGWCKCACNHPECAQRRAAAGLAPLGATDDPWFERRPWLGLTVAVGGPLVLGLILAALLGRPRA